MLNSLRSDRRIPNSPAHPVLLGEPERGRLKIKDEGLKTKDQRLKSKHYHLCHSGMVLAGIHSVKTVDTGMRRYDSFVLRRFELPLQAPPNRF